MEIPIFGLNVYNFASFIPTGLGAAHQGDQMRWCKNCQRLTKKAQMTK